MKKNKLIEAFNDIIKHLYETMDDTIHSVADALEISKEKTFLISHFLLKNEVMTVSTEFGLNQRLRTGIVTELKLSFFSQTKLFSKSFDVAEP